MAPRGKKFPKHLRSKKHAQLKADAAAQTDATPGVPVADAYTYYGAFGDYSGDIAHKMSESDEFGDKWTFHNETAAVCGLIKLFTKKLSDDGVTEIKIPLVKDPRELEDTYEALGNIYAKHFKDREAPMKFLPFQRTTELEGTDPFVAPMAEFMTQVVQAMEDNKKELEQALEQDTPEPAKQKEEPALQSYSVSWVSPYPGDSHKVDYEKALETVPQEWWVAQSVVKAIEEEEQNKIDPYLPALIQPTPVDPHLPIVVNYLPVPFEPVHEATMTMPDFGDISIGDRDGVSTQTKATAKGQKKWMARIAPTVLSIGAGALVKMAFTTAASSICPPVGVAIVAGMAAGAASRIIAKSFDKNTRSQRFWWASEGIIGMTVGALGGLGGFIAADWLVNSCKPFQHFKEVATQFVGDNISHTVQAGANAAQASGITPTSSGIASDAIAHVNAAHDPSTNFVATKQAPTKVPFMDTATGHAAPTVPDVSSAPLNLKDLAKFNPTEVMSKEQFAGLPKHLQEWATSGDVNKFMAFCDQASTHIYSHAPHNAGAQKAAAGLANYAVRFAEANNLSGEGALKNMGTLHRLYANNTYFVGHGIGTVKDTAKAVASALKSSDAVNNFGARFLKSVSKMTLKV